MESILHSGIKSQALPWIPSAVGEAGGNNLGLETICSLSNLVTSHMRPAWESNLQPKHMP